MLSKQESQSKFAEEMTRHGIMKDIKGIEQAYETSPGRETTTIPGVGTVA